jgi:hypothetical protein
MIFPLGVVLISHPKRSEIEDKSQEKIPIAGNPSVIEEMHTLELREVIKFFCPTFFCHYF